MSTKLLLAIGLAMLWAMAPAAAVCPLADPADCVYVDDDCVTNPGSGAANDPFCRIQDAYDFVVSTTTPAGDSDCLATPGAGTPSKPFCPATILVRPGIYNECIDAATTFEVDPAFNDDRPAQFVADAWLVAGSPNPDPANPASFEAVAQATLITGLGVCDGAATTRLPAISIAGTGASVKGFAITQGGASGVEARGSVTVANNLILENDGVLGGGVQLGTTVCTYGDVTAFIRNNVVRHNLSDDLLEFGAGDGGGIFVVADGSPPDFSCLGGKSEVTIADNLVRNNTGQNRNIDPGQNDTFAGGGGISVETFTETADAVPEDSGAHILVSGNTIFQNLVVPGNDGVGFGAGIFASTLGFGKETIEIQDNTVGPNNVASGSSFGGGISTAATPFVLGDHEISIRRNSIRQNSAAVGGGIDVFAIAEELFQDQRLAVFVTHNDIRNNVSQGEAAGLNAEFNSIKSLDADDKATLFPSAPSAAAEMTFEIRGNTIVANSSGTAGGGAVLRPSADSDPVVLAGFCFPSLQLQAAATIDFTSNLVQQNVAEDTALFGGTPGCSDLLCQVVICSGDPFCCDTAWDQFCADAAADDPNCDCDTSNCCVPTETEVIGAGVLAFPSAKGQAVARVHMATTTVVGNTMTADAFVGGVEITSATAVECCGTTQPPPAACNVPGSGHPFRGTSEVRIDRSIVANNHADGIGGPPIDRQQTDQTVIVSKSSAFGNGDTNSNNDPDLNYEETLFPDGPPPGNILSDPLLDPVTFVPDLCSPVYDVGYCSNAPSSVCITDGNCGSPNVCVAEGAGYLASPDINDDDALDGVDVVRFSLAFGAEEGADRYNPDADIDSSGMIDGLDLPFLAPLFGRECAAP